MKIFLSVFSGIVLAVSVQAQGLQEQAREYRQEGYRLQSMGDLSKALQFYEKAAQINPHYAEVHNDLGVVYEALGRDDEALRMYKKTLEIDPDYLPTYTNLAFLYEKRGEIENATLYWKKRYLAGEEGSYWWEVARQHLLKLGTYPEVRHAVLEQEAARLSREVIYRREQQRLKLIDEARLHFDLGNNYLNAKDYGEAVNKFRAVLSLNAPDSELNNKARNLYEQAQRLHLRQQAHVNTRNALDFIEKDDYLSAAERLKNALTAVFRITQTE